MAFHTGRAKETGPMPQALQQLRQEHANFAKLLSILEEQLRLFDEAEQPDYDLVGGIVDYCRRFPDAYHHPKEDLIKARLDVRDPKAGVRVGDLEGENEALAALTRKAEEAVGNVLGDVEVPRDHFHNVMRHFIDRYRAHMTMEERDFLPAAEKALSQEDWDEIDARVANPEDPLFGPDTGRDEFDGLRRHLIEWDRADRAAAER
jgi:hemerythrin-like domain-containing protein